MPEGIHTRAGSMTELPFEDGFFDAAYATESLEHAVEIEKAVSEICRVVKPGGRIAIIDKNAEQWGKLKTPEWEQWFTRKGLERLLRRHCRQVSSRYISYWEDVEPDGLFLAWLAVVLMASGKAEEARSCWRRAIREKPELAEAYFEL